MTIINNEANRIRISVNAGETSQWFMVGGSAAIIVKPGAGGTMTVEQTLSPPTIVRGDNNNGTSNAIALEWDDGAVSAVAGAEVGFATAIRVKAFTAAGVADLAL